jgi:hypothetical protein
MWDGGRARGDVPGATGTQVNLSSFEADAGDAPKLVDRLSQLAVGGTLPSPARNAVIQAVQTYGVAASDRWRTERVQQAAFLVFAAPQYQVQR